ncbi:hypothetical protein [Nonomuraea sp. NPDC052265]
MRAPGARVRGRLRRPARPGRRGRPRRPAAEHGARDDVALLALQIP